MTLKELPIGKTATIVSVGGEGALRQHFLDMGLIPTGDVTMVKYAPMGDPVELRIHSYELTLRLADAEKIEIENVRDAEAAQKKELKQSVPHPGLGEGGKFHMKETENPLPDGTVLTFALAGNQNCGKTTLFNQLTGSTQHVGNFPGVTVDRKDGQIRGRKNTLVTDLPGIYSMSPYSSEEIVTRNFVLNEHPKGIINIVDATNIERNLYLTMQLMELNIPMVLALNMMDEVRENGGSILINRMEEMLGIRTEEMDAVVPESLPNTLSFAGKSWKAGQLREVSHVVEDAENPVEVLSAYEQDYYQGFPALTRKKYGKGSALYLACEAEEGFLKVLYEKLAEEYGIRGEFTGRLPKGVVVSRRDGDQPVWFLQNFNRAAVQVELPFPFHTVEDGRVLEENVTLRPYECLILTN